ncbi:MAG: CPBP family intramembrane metalloprotease [Prevotella sp.]|nr:CPBP family intramembrane metalloprotease [Prevotella sp.]
MKKAIVYLVLFVAIQLIVTYCVMGVWYLVAGAVPQNNGPLLVTTSILYGVITIVLFTWQRWSPVSGNYIKSRPWAVLFWTFLVALGIILPSVWFQEKMPELPNLLDDSFEGIVNTPGGYLALGIIAPLAEEVVFRGAILRSLLEKFSKPWIAIAVSALLFALIHLNPAQLPHAFVVGLLLGWMYWRTGSIIPGVLLHVVNNTVSYISIRLYPHVEDLSLADIFGSEAGAWKAVGFSLLILLPSLYQLYLRMKRAR